jgi:hypothetical protein
MGLRAQLHPPQLDSKPCHAILQLRPNISTEKRRKLLYRLGSTVKGHEIHSCESFAVADLGRAKFELGENPTSNLASLGMTPVCPRPKYKRVENDTHTSLSVAESLCSHAHHFFGIEADEAAEQRENFSKGALPQPCSSIFFLLSTRCPLN